uniref:Uncharacterized protein n=1 Tax=Anguilla anguilla TaxID=7936 RepID=A0A0E9UZX7_ANGAN
MMSVSIYFLVFLSCCWGVAGRGGATFCLLQPQSWGSLRLWSRKQLITPVLKCHTYALRQG